MYSYDNFTTFLKKTAIQIYCSHRQPKLSVRGKIISDDIFKIL
mgnify:CR=1 FL=1